MGCTAYIWNLKYGIVFNKVHLMLVWMNWRVLIHLELAIELSRHVTQAAIPLNGYQACWIALIDNGSLSHTACTVLPIYVL